MTREELIKQCRYYKGEKENPYSGSQDNKGALWDYEHYWCEKYTEDPSYFDEFISWYKEAGLEKYRDRETPLSLMALIFSRYLHWFTCYTAEDERDGFIDWCEKYYLGKKN